MRQHAVDLRLLDRGVVAIGTGNAHQKGCQRKAGIVVGHADCGRVPSIGAKRSAIMYGYIVKVRGGAKPLHGMRIVPSAIFTAEPATRMAVRVP